MKTYLYSMKLAAAFGLLVASVALAGPHDNSLVIVSQDEPRTGPDLPVYDPNIGQPLELNTPEIEPQPPANLPGTGTLDNALVVDTRRRIEPASHWIGIQCQRLPDVLRNYLDIPAGQGVLIAVVVPEAPAAKAGIVQNDILLSGNKQPLQSAADVSRLVTKAKDQPITFDLIRKGRHMTIDITPAENPLNRPPKDMTSTEKSMPSEQRDKFNRWLNRQRQIQGFRPRMRLQFMNPGIILPADAPIHPALPGGMSITIMKKGDEPTQITVARGDDIWKVDEKNLDKLPKDIRPSVERMLNGLVIGPEAMAPRLDYMPELFDKGQLPNPAEIEAAARQRMHRQMERMNQRLEELHKMIEGIRDKKGPEEKK